MRRIRMRYIVLAVVPAILPLAACGNPATSSSWSPTTTIVPISVAVPPAGLSCAAIGGVFVPHGTDGRGDCEPADARAQCHMPPAQQDGNYVAGFELDPPFPQGTVARAVVETMLQGASNADCWHLPG